MVTASLFKNEEAFLALCADHAKCSPNKQRVILFKEQCQFFGTPGYGNASGGTQYFHGGANPLLEVKDVQKKSFEFEFALKRMNITVGSLKDEFKEQDRRLEKVETQFKMVKQQVIAWAEENGKTEEIARVYNTSTQVVENPEN